VKCLLSNIVGIDILPGSYSQESRTGTRKRFAVAIAKDGEFIKTYNEVSSSKLIRLCKEYEPEYLGVDNIFELEPNSGRVIHFCSLLPMKTKVIQVTGAPPDGFEPLTRLANRYNIPYPSQQHADPLQTAQIICMLAEKKVGYILIPFEQETEIKISRTRSVGPGGWSQQRYSRRMRGRIRNLARDMEDNLKDHDIDYDIEARKTEYGYDNAVFRAYATVDKIREIIKPFKGQLARIEIKPIRKKRLEFIPASGGRKQIAGGIGRKLDRGLIVGIDPGTNTGIAVLNFHKKVLHLDTKRSAARGDIIREITIHGDPILIAADVTPPPEFVVKISKMLNANLYYPERLYKSSSKAQVVNDFAKEHELKVTGAHNRDALFAAVKAAHQYSDLLERIDKELHGPQDLKLRNRVKKLVIKEEMNIKDAIDRVREQIEKLKAAPEEVEEKEEEKELTELEKKLTEKNESLRESIRRQVKQIDNLENLSDERYQKVVKLRKQNQELRNRLSRMRNKEHKELKRERLISSKDKELKYLRQKVSNLEEKLINVKKIIADLKRMIVMNSNKIVVPLKVVHEFSEEGIKKTIEKMNIDPYDVILLQDPSGGGQNTAEILIKRDIRAVVCSKKGIADQAKEAFIEAGIPVLFDLHIRQIDDIAVTFYNELEKAIKEWHESRNEILYEKKERELDALISEYQENRKRELEHIYSRKKK
jgi:hypothetical protein